MIFIGFGFVMTFLRRYGFSNVAYNMMLAAFVIQWSTITLGVLGFIGKAQDGETKFHISVGLERYNLLNKGHFQICT